MAEVPRTGTEVPIEAMLLMPAVLGLHAWQGVAKSQAPTVALRQRATLTIELLQQLIGAPIPDELITALSADDPRAFAAVAAALHQVDAACDHLIERGRQQSKQGAWHILWRESRVALKLASATGSARRQAQAALLASTAARGLGDNTSAASALQTAVEAAAEAGDRRMLAISNGNLANTLRDSGRIDDALPHYDEALGWEDDANGRAQIRSNQAQAFALLGEGRQALATLKRRVADLESTRAPPAELAIALGIVAGEELRLGAARDALALLERARGLLASDDWQGLAVTALQQAAAWRTLNDPHAAAAFEEAWTHATKHAIARLSPPNDAHYVKGFATACLTRLSFDQVAPMVVGGVAAKGQDQWAEAQQRLAEAFGTARAANDAALCLRIQVNMAAVAADAGQVRQALEYLTLVRREASQRGLSLPEAMATGALGAIAARTGHRLDPLGPMGLYARTQALAALHVRLLESSALSLQERQWDIAALKTGVLDNQIALLAQSYGADKVAAAAFRRAAAAVPSGPPTFELANRLSGLLDALDRLGRKREAARIAAQLGRLIASGGLHGRGQLVVHRALGSHLAAHDPPAAIDHLRSACTEARRLREQLPAGSMRSQANRDFAHLHRNLAHLLQQRGQDREAFEAVQHDKSRRLTDAMALRNRADDSPPTLERVQALLQPDDLLVDLVLDEGGITAYLVRGVGHRSLRVEGATRALMQFEPGDNSERESTLLSLCLSNALLQELVLRVESDPLMDAQTRLILVPDDALHNLPLHVVPFGGRPWCRTRPMGMLPCAGVLALLDPPNSSMQCLVAGDSALNLPGAAAECAEVARVLGTPALIGADGGRGVLSDALQNNTLDVIHLAIHGRGDPANGGRASLLIGDDSGGVAWMPFEEIATLRWRCNFMALSGCSTGAAGPHAGHELISLARSALEAGAASVLGCLWPVGDEVARVFMSAFYGALKIARAQGTVDLRDILAVAQDTLVSADATRLASGAWRDGRMRPRPAMQLPALDNTALWAPFVLFGRPTLVGMAPA